MAALSSTNRQPNETDRLTPEELRLVTRDLAVRLRSKPIVIYSGAGVSLDGPEGLPTGAEVARFVARRVASTLGLTDDQVETSSLEELGEIAEGGGPHAVSLLREHAAQGARFEHVQPNDSHRAIASLLREGAVKSLTVNWDKGIENAATQLGFQIEAVVRAQDLQEVGEPRHLKLHGCASRPQTLKISKDEIDNPPPWVVTETEHSLQGATVLFLGLGTVGAYVSEGMEVLADRWVPSTDSIYIVDVKLSQSWREALDERAEEEFRCCDSATFLAELLLGCFENFVMRTTDLARGRQDTDKACAAAVAGGERLLNVLSTEVAMEAWQWCRSGCPASDNGKRLITADGGEQALFPALIAIGDRPVKIDGGVEDVRLSTPDTYVELAHSPRTSFPDEVLNAQRERFRQRRGRYTDSGKDVTVCCTGHMGQLPGSEAVQDIGEDPRNEFDIADGAEDFRRLRLVDLQHLVARAA